MCGISGIYQIKDVNNKLKQAVDFMNQSQINRGPDDSGIFINEKRGIGLGHQRLSIIDLSKKGKQPMGFNDIWITYNGEIYNFLELKQDLKEKGYKFKTKTDTEVILALYSEYSEMSFSMLRGMFAFGLWDGKKQKLFLVKDRYGIKPLYYYSDKEKLIFASTVKAITKSGLVSVKNNPQALIGFLLFGSVPLPMTTVRDVFAVPAGHYLVRNADGQQKIIQYYDPLVFYQHKSAENQHESAPIEIRQLLEESVNLHLISDAPLGIFLSGGLDSSALAALAAQIIRNQHKSTKIGVNQRLTTLSVVFKEKEFSEKKYQDLVVKKIGSEHREIKITSKDFFDSFGEIFEAMDQPTIDGVNSFFIAKAAKQAGLKAVLSGLGADEIFCGYAHFQKAELIKSVQKLPRFLKSPLNLASLLGDRYSKLNYLASSNALGFYLGIRGLFSPQEIAKILDINLSEVNNFINELAQLQQLEYTKQLEQLHPVDLLSYLELKFYLQNQLLKDTDFMSMHHSIEVRVPFLDHKVVEYLSSLPPELKLNQHKSATISINQRHKINKPLLVEAVRDLLPKEILSRKKMGFTFPFEKWLREAPNNLITNNSIIHSKTHWSKFWATTVASKWY